MWSFPSHTEMYQNGSLNIPDEVQVHPVAEKNFINFYISHSSICMDGYRIQWKACSHIFDWHLTI